MVEFHTVEELPASTAPGLTAAWLSKALPRVSCHHCDPRLDYYTFQVVGTQKKKTQQNRKQNRKKPIKSPESQAYSLGSNDHSESIYLIRHQQPLTHQRADQPLPTKACFSISKQKQNRHFHLKGGKKKKKRKKTTSHVCKKAWQVKCRGSSQDDEPMIPHWKQSSNVGKIISAFFRIDNHGGGGILDQWRQQWSFRSLALMGFRILMTEGTPKSLHEEPNPPRAISVVQETSPRLSRMHSAQERQECLREH